MIDWLGIFLSLTCLGFVFGAIYTAQKSLHKRLYWIKTQGTVIEPLAMPRDPEEPFFRERARFSLNGSEYIATSTTLVRPATRVIGSSINIHYPKNAPEQAELYLWRDLWFLPVFLGVMAVIFSLLTIEHVSALASLTPSPDPTFTILDALD
ncbi:DUF3592 domain-containing protein [Patescibacteria group bacterium]|nr:DUF3592 domain-containing protein [Patescibacteria group bacterium]MDQ5919775.1 hypothetical protein [Patescibacteria group bacterium]